jgi:hypothetical protein
MTLFEPDAFLNDWYGYVTNQAGHFLIVGAVAFALLSWALKSRERGFIALTLAYVGFEAAHRWLFWGSLADSIEDTFFVLSGAAFAWAAWEGRKLAMVLTLVVAMVVMAVGAWMRK